MKTHIRLLLAAMMLLIRADAVAGDEVKSESEPSSLATRILKITQLVLEKHIDPPAQQQMILSGSKALYRAAGEPIPRDLSARVSLLATTDELAEFVDGIAAKFAESHDVEQSFTKGLFDSLPGGARLIAEEVDRIEQQVAANRYVGVGIQLAMHSKEKLPHIPRVFYNSPAWKAGVKENDLILEIDGKTTAAKSLTEVLEYSRGEDGSQVTFLVRQPNTRQTRKLTITRGRVFIPTVEGIRESPDGRWVFTTDGEEKIAVLRFSSIGPSTLHELRQAARQLGQEGIRGIILDLRTGGGLLHDTILAADSLLDGGTIGYVQSLESITKHEAGPGALFQDLPMAVLVSKTMSAGNVFLTAALQDNKRAIVVGEPTTGKTYIRSILPLSDRGDKIVMATGLMLRGDKTPLLISRARLPVVKKVEHADTQVRIKRPNFIMPDHVVQITRTPSNEPGQDAVLDTAIDVLATAMPHRES